MPDFSRILVVRTDRLGDVILTLPMLTVLRRRFPTAHLSMLVNRYAGEIVEGNGHVNQLIWYDDEKGLIPLPVILKRLRREQFDACVVVHPTPRLALLMFLAGIPVRVGSGYRFYAPLFNRRVYTHRKTAERHEAEYNLELLEQLGCVITPGDIPGTSITIPEEARRKAEHLLAAAHVQRKYAVIHPGTGGSAREWPSVKFGLLSQSLKDRWGISVVVTGSMSERARTEEVVRASGGGAVSLAGQLTLKELAALLQQACLFVSNSTGPLHLAVALDTPVLAFYPQIPVMGPRRWGPRTTNARVLVPEKPEDCTVCTRRPTVSCECMDSITVEQALSAAEELLGAPAPSFERAAHEQ